MNVKTRFELREFSKIAGLTDFVGIRMYDELESAEAKGAYQDAVLRANAVIGTVQTFTSPDGVETKGKVLRHVVELFECKTDGSRSWNGKMVGSSEFDEGMRLVLEAAKDETPAATGVPTQQQTKGE